MLAGYVTYEELKIITGYSDKTLNKLILKGLPMNELNLQPLNKYVGKNLKQQLFNLQEVENWLKLYVF